MGTWMKMKNREGRRIGRGKMTDEGREGMEEKGRQKWIVHRWEESGEEWKERQEPGKWRGEKGEGMDTETRKEERGRGRGMGNGRKEGGSEGEKDREENRIEEGRGNGR